MLLYTCSILKSAAATKFTENNNDLHKNALKVDISKEYLASSKDVIRDRKLDSGTIEGNDEEHVTTILTQQEYTLKPNGKNKFPTAIQRSCPQKDKCDYDTTEHKAKRTRTEMVQTNELKYPVKIFHLKKKKKRRNKRPQIEYPVTEVDRFTSGCIFGEISLGGMCIHSDGFF